MLAGYEELAKTFEPVRNGETKRRRTFHLPDLTEYDWLWSDTGAKCDSYGAPCVEVEPMLSSTKGRTKLNLPYQIDSDRHSLAVLNSLVRFGTMSGAAWLHVRTVHYIMRLSTFWGRFCSSNWYAWYNVCGLEGPGVELKVHLMSRRGAGRDGCFRSFRRLVNAHASDAKKFDRFANTRNSGIHSTKCKTFRFALPTGNLFTKGNEIRAWFQLVTRKAFGKISDCKVYKSIRIMLIQAHWTGCGFQGYEF